MPGTAYHSAKFLAVPNRNTRRWYRRIIQYPYIPFQVLPKNQTQHIEGMFFMNKLLQDLYYGRIPGWDSQVHTTETEEDRQKILSERRYFTSLLSAKDLDRYKKLEALHTKSHARRYENTYINAFKLGIMLMCAVFANDGDMYKPGKEGEQPNE